jgi:GNAT superfamily N-acetyltransferase
MAEAQTQRGQAGRPLVAVRPLREDDLDDADRIMRLAFGTFMGLPEPLTFMGDAGMVRTRWHADPTASLAAELNGELVGTNILSHWGSVGFFGPLSVQPDLWDAGVAQQLLAPTMQRFADWGVTHAGLYTFSDSPKHIHLYQKFDFWPRFLTALMAKPVAATGNAAHGSSYAATPMSERAAVLDACRQLTDAIYPGLDLSIEIRAVAAQQLGDTVLLWRDQALVGLAICHCGAGTEAGSGVCYIKFAAVRPGIDAARDFDALLDGCEALAAERGMARLVGGINTSHNAAYRQMMAHGFRTDREGVIMQRNNEPGYHHAESYVIDDWR